MHDIPSSTELSSSYIMSASTASTTAYTTAVTAPVGGWRHVRLPPEMLLMIFKCLAQCRSFMALEALKNCALLCHSWKSETQKLLFQAVNINMQLPIRRSIDWEDQSYMDKEPWTHPLFDDLSPRLLSHITSVSLESMRVSDNWVFISDVLQVVRDLPQLVTLTIDSLDLGGDSYYVNVAPAPSVEEIHLTAPVAHQGYEVPQSCLFRFLVLFPRLKRLCLSSIAFREPLLSLPHLFQRRCLPQLETVELLDCCTFISSTWFVLDAIRYFSPKLSSLTMGCVNYRHLGDIDMILKCFGPTLRELQLYATSQIHMGVPMIYPAISNCDNLQSLHLGCSYDTNQWLEDVCETISAISCKHSQQIRITVDVRFENYLKNVVEEAVQQKWQHWGRIINQRPSVVVIIQVIHCDTSTAEKLEIFSKGIEQAHMELNDKERLEVHFLSEENMDENDRWV